VRVSTRLRKRGRPRLAFRLNTTMSDKKTARSNLRTRPTAAPRR